MARKDSINRMRSLLVKRRDALRKALAGDLSLLTQLRQQSGGDEVDAAIDSAQDEISSQLAEAESRELAHVEHALESIRRGVYGICEACGRKIPIARLNALPYATLCIECQQASEDGTLEGRGSVGGQAADWGRVVDTGLTPEVDISLTDIEL